MAWQDLTPQLRTRLSRIERAVGLFVGLAILLLVVGFVYYIHSMAQRKGWFLIKVPYFTYLSSGAGLRVGDTVKLMGFEAGEITRITAEDPSTAYNVYVEFVIKEPYYGYLWTLGSSAKVNTADLLGHRVIEVSKGTNGQPTYREASAHRWFGADKKITGVWDDKAGAYQPYTESSKPYWLEANESPALGDRLEALANRVENALPDILHLTNQISLVLSNAATMTARATDLLADVHPTVTNLAVITSHLIEPQGSLGDWILPTNLNSQLLETLGSTKTTLNSAETNLTALAENLGRSLDHLADLTSNLNAQVQINTNILGEISKAVVNADDLVQGLKRHWFLRSAFKVKETNHPPSRAVSPRR